MYVNMHCRNTISTVTWRTVHERILADVLRSKKSLSALLTYIQETPQK